MLWIKRKQYINKWKKNTQFFFSELEKRKLDYYMLIPSSCKTKDKFDVVDQECGLEITTKEIFPIKRQNYQGKPRQDHLTVYTLKKDGKVIVW